MNFFSLTRAKLFYLVCLKPGLRLMMNIFYETSAFRLMNCFDVKEVEIMKQRKADGVTLLVPLTLAPKEHKHLVTFQKSKIELNCFECHYNFSNSCRSKTLLNVIFSPLKPNQNDFREHLLRKIDNASSEWLPITVIGDYDLNFLQRLNEKKA